VRARSLAHSWKVGPRGAHWSGEVGSSLKLTNVNKLCLRLE